MGYCGVRFGREFGGLPLLLENVKEDDGTAPPPETPTETMEFLARSWSLSATELSKALGDALPPTSSRDLEDYKFLRGGQRGKTMTGWLKDNKERRRSEARTRGAQIYAAISVAGVAAVVAATASGSVFSPDSVPSKCGGSSKAGAAMASAAALVASHCIESARAIGASRQQILAVIHSAVNVRTTGDVMALTAGAATALRAAAILGARMKKETNGGVLIGDDKEADGCSSALAFVYRGGELLKRTRKGDLHWKQVSVCINSYWQVVVKMKSRCIAGTFVKKKKVQLLRYALMCLHGQGGVRMEAAQELILASEHWRG
ncbi:hypothetical protein HPP92_023542 [Vanilla planifolia]|uniref:VAN3-binding protein-like auxin canalisation domain-containing protein n=1 Tax=Vanilla planifolia TaxID=51239 RepID=A0A835UAH8_VANPL|nr:hypothetical protein HPP92_023542 [Vanilla planifolia]